MTVSYQVKEIESDIRLRFWEINPCSCVQGEIVDIS